MGGADHPRLGIGEQHRGAIGGEDAQRDAGQRRDHAIAFRPGGEIPVRAHDMDNGAVNLRQGDEPGSGRQRRDDAGAVLGHGGGDRRASRDRN